jgi:hypothetical protein
MFPGLSRRDDCVSVQGIGENHVDNLNVGVAAHSRQLAVTVAAFARHTILGGDEAHLLRIAADQSGQAGVLTLGECG